MSDEEKSTYEQLRDLRARTPFRGYVVKAKSGEHYALCSYKTVAMEIKKILAKRLDIELEIEEIEWNLDRRYISLDNRER